MKTKQKQTIKQELQKVLSLLEQIQKDIKGYNVDEAINKLTFIIENQLKTKAEILQKIKYVENEIKDHSKKCYEMYQEDASRLADYCAKCYDAGCLIYDLKEILWKREEV